MKYKIFRAAALCCMLLALTLRPSNLLPAAAQEPESVQVPIMMYHNLLKSAAGKLSITPKAFEKDLQYLSENGYHTVGIAELIEFVTNKQPLPDKPVVLTFDDGYYNNYVYAMPLLEKYDSKLVLSVIGEHTEIWSKEGGTDERYGHVTWSQISEMVATGRVEIANHTQMLHHNCNGRKGCKIKKGEDKAAYEKLLTADVQALQTRLEEMCGIRPQCFTYPFGSNCPESVDVLKQLGLQASLSCAGGNNAIVAGDPDCLFNLKRNNRTPDMPVEAILKKLEAFK